MGHEHSRFNVEEAKMWEALKQERAGTPGGQGYKMEWKK